MESLSGNQIQDLKELYKGIYNQTIDETTADLTKLDKEQRDAIAEATGDWLASWIAS